MKIKEVESNRKVWKADSEIKLELLRNEKWKIYFLLLIKTFIDEIFALQLSELSLYTNKMNHQSLKEKNV